MSETLRHDSDRWLDIPEARVGYLWVPHLALSVVLRERPEPGGGQVIVAEDRAGGGVVMDASDECLAMGVRVGRPIREAREYCPGAVVLPADHEAIRRAHEELLGVVEQLAPEVEDDGLGRVLFAPDRPVCLEDARWMLATLRAMVRKQLGLRTHLALAPGPFAARVAAEHAPEAATGTPVIPAGEVAAYLAPLPLGVLPLPPRALERLRLLGIATVGQFARLPRGGLARRFGREAVGAHKLAHGEDPRRVVGRIPPEIRTARHAYEPPVESLEPLLAVASRLLEGLCAELRAEGKAFRRISIMVEEESGEASERTAELRRSVTTLAGCRAVLRSLVQGAAPGGAVTAITVALSAIAPAESEQLGLFGDGSIRDERKRRLEEATREVGRRYPRRLRRVVPSDLPTLLDEHRFALLPYDPDGGHDVPPEVPPSSLRRIEVERRDGRPYIIEEGRWDEILSVHGCWRAEEWWPREIERVYWRVRTRSARVLTLGRDAEGWRLVEVLD
ncbi:MAG: DNA polymerase Y family protein [Actinomycetota bacterium]|nr:DNA polymerase Y family protein [Actinomycetota bacterium]